MSISPHAGHFLPLVPSIQNAGQIPFDDGIFIFASTYPNPILTFPVPVILADVQLYVVPLAFVFSVCALIFIVPLETETFSAL